MPACEDFRTQWWAIILFTGWASGSYYRTSEVGKILTLPCKHWGVSVEAGAPHSAPYQCVVADWPGYCVGVSKETYQWASSIVFWCILSQRRSSPLPHLALQLWLADLIGKPKAATVINHSCHHQSAFSNRDIPMKQNRSLPFPCSLRLGSAVFCFLYWNCDYQKDNEKTVRGLESFQGRNCNYSE